MTQIAELAREAIHNAREERRESSAIRKLFVVMHGSYGNAFLSKWSTGQLDDSGSDKGVRAAMLVWDSTLRKFSDDVIEIAAGRMRSTNPEFPPSLPQFEKLCDAAAPRKSYAQEEGIRLLPPPAPVKVSFAMRGDCKDWARRILARQEHGDKSLTRAQLSMARDAMGVQ